MPDKEGFSMKKSGVLALLRENDAWKLTEDGPVAMMVSDGDKTRWMTAARAGNFLKVSTGRWFRRTRRIAIREI